MRSSPDSHRARNKAQKERTGVPARDGMSVSRLITTLRDELMEARGEVTNFASFPGVCRGRYLMLQVSGRIPVDVGGPIRSLDPDYVLAEEGYPARSPAAAYAMSASTDSR